MRICLAAVSLSFIACGLPAGGSDVADVESDTGTLSMGVVTSESEAGITGTEPADPVGTTTDATTTGDDDIPPLKPDVLEPGPVWDFPPGCPLPEQPNADITGTKALKRTHLQAAAVAISGGIYAGWGFRVLAMHDIDALAMFVADYDGSISPDVLSLRVVWPNQEGPTDWPKAPTVGTWEAFGSITSKNWFPWSASGTAEVTRVPARDDVEPMLEAHFVLTDENGVTVQGWVSAPYCSNLSQGDGH